VLVEKGFWFKDGKGDTGEGGNAEGDGFGEVMY
jgi:hypothetical protein